MKERENCVIQLFFCIKYIHNALLREIINYAPKNFALEILENFIEIHGLEWFRWSDK